MSIKSNWQRWTCLQENHCAPTQDLIKPPGWMDHSREGWERGCTSAWWLGAEKGLREKERGLLHGRALIFLMEEAQRPVRREGGGGHGRSMLYIHQSARSEASIRPPRSREDQCPLREPLHTDDSLPLPTCDTQFLGPTWLVRSFRT